MVYGLFETKIESVGRDKNKTNLQTSIFFMAYPVQLEIEPVGGNKIRIKFYKILHII